MSMRNFRKFFIVILVSFGLNMISFPAYAVVIDFEEINRSYSGNSLDSKGFNFFNDCQNFALCILHRDPNSRYNADPGGVTFAQNSPKATTTLTNINGNAFDLISIDFADYFNFRTPQNILLIGTYAIGGTISQTIALQTIFGLETFIFNWQGLTQVSWVETTGNWLQFDNVIVQEIVPQAKSLGVPAPASMALLGLGLLGFFAARRKRHHKFFA
ncbi:MAG: hypothetical protein COA93_10605 [Alphaproteobacteria bacterium]|nr:MAG: hypothetical protein COA93_10605 [Alphaproteobacteria bacterium]